MVARVRSSGFPATSPSPVPGEYCRFYMRYAVTVLNLPLSLQRFEYTVGQQPFNVTSSP